MAGWRWFFRTFTLSKEVPCSDTDESAVAVPFSLIAWRLAPNIPGARAQSSSKWKQFDLVGCALILGSCLCLALGLTFGTSDGWRSAQFLVPFLISWPLLVLFFFHEDRLPPGMALLPSSFWKLPNIPLLMFAALEILTYWPVRADHAESADTSRSYCFLCSNDGKASSTNL